MEDEYVPTSPAKAELYKRVLAENEDEFAEALREEAKREHAVNNIKLRNLASADGRGYIHRALSRLSTKRLRAWNGVTGSISRFPALRTFFVA